MVLCKASIRGIPSISAQGTARGNSTVTRHRLKALSARNMKPTPAAADSRGFGDIYQTGMTFGMKMQSSQNA